MDNSTQELKALALRCRELARRTRDEETSASLESLASYYEAQALVAEPAPEPPIEHIRIQPE